jgi:hypothetical protein
MFGQKLPLVRFMGLPPTASTTGDLEQMSLLAGESCGLINDVRPVAEILAGIREQAEAVISTRLR